MRRSKLDERSFWRGKIIRRQLLTVIVADPQQLDQKKKLVMYTKAFVRIYNWRFRELVHKTYGIGKLKRYPISRAENFFNIGGQ